MRQSSPALLAYHAELRTAEQHRRQQERRNRFVLLSRTADSPNRPVPIRPFLTVPLPANRVGAPARTASNSSQCVA